MKITSSFNEHTNSEKKSLYIFNMRPVADDKAMFADATESYRSPSQPLKNSYVTLRFRTGKYNCDLVNVVVNGNVYKMSKARSDRRFDYYEARVYIGTETTQYYYEAYTGKTVIYYNQVGAFRELNPTYNFIIYPGFVVPEWVKGAVIYQIYVDRFYNGDTSNDVVDNEYVYIGEPVKRVTDWNKYPAEMGVREFYGGDLQGVIDKLD